MQEVFPDGKTKETDGATQEDILRATKDMLAGKVTQIHAYKPGEIVTLPSGARYLINQNGSWIRQSKGTK